ncbi:hypothetical protein [Desulfospira joergensenii]|uniref:hypothetical protein n=1 Tax=Desulfospira joergensenii TaxID=53329 RepID=UPI0003B41067|nr:hypothetical protein [Desulfospira joergensenii]
MNEQEKQISPIQFKPSRELDERLDRLAKKADLSKAQLVSNIVNEVSKDLEMCEKVGVYQFGVLLRNMSEALSEWSEKIKMKKVDPL